MAVNDHTIGPRRPVNRGRHGSRHPLRGSTCKNPTLKAARTVGMPVVAGRAGERRGQVLRCPKDGVPASTMARSGPPWRRGNSDPRDYPPMGDLQGPWLRWLRSRRGVHDLDRHFGRRLDAVGPAEQGERSPATRWCSCRARRDSWRWSEPVLRPSAVVGPGGRRVPARPWRRLRQTDDRVRRGGLRRRRGPHSWTCSASTGQFWPGTRARVQSSAAWPSTNRNAWPGWCWRRHRRRFNGDARLEEFVTTVVSGFWRIPIGGGLRPLVRRRHVRRRGSTPRSSSSSWTSCSRSRLACGRRRSPDSCATDDSPELGYIAAPALPVWGDGDALGGARHAGAAGRAHPRRDLARILPRASDTPRGWERPDTLRRRCRNVRRAIAPSAKSIGTDGRSCHQEASARSGSPPGPWIASGPVLRLRCWFARRGYVNTMAVRLTAVRGNALRPSPRGPLRWHDPPG